MRFFLIPFHGIRTAHSFYSCSSIPRSWVSLVASPFILRWWWPSVFSNIDKGSKSYPRGNTVRTGEKVLVTWFPFGRGSGARFHKPFLGLQNWFWLGCDDIARWSWAAIFNTPLARAEKDAQGSMTYAIFIFPSYLKVNCRGDTMEHRPSGA